MSVEVRLGNPDLFGLDFYHLILWGVFFLVDFKKNISIVMRTREEGRERGGGREREEYQLVVPFSCALTGYFLYVP